MLHYFDIFIYLLKRLQVSIKDIINIYIPQFLVSPALPLVVISIWYDVILYQHLEGLSKSRSCAISLVLFIGDSDKDFEPFVSNEGFIGVVFGLHVFYFDVGGDEETVDVLLLQVFVDESAAAGVVSEAVQLNEGEDVTGANVKVLVFQEQEVSAD